MFYRLGLIGYPLAQSKSPPLHSAALQAAGLAGSYQLFPIAPPDLEGLSALVQRLRQPDAPEGLHGLNVTIPHKQNVIPLLDDLAPTAQAVGAVNTLIYRNGRLLGDNSDVPGFLHDLQRLAYPHLAGPSRRALVLGAGGSARAVVYALLLDGWQVALAARRLEQAQELAAALQTAGAVECLHLTAAGLRALTPTLIVNTTPVGMLPFPEASPWPAELAFPTDAVVYDLIYKPPRTQLLRHAQQAGLAAFNGLGMLVEQAAVSFERWTGVNADRSAMWAAVEPAQPNPAD